MRISDWSADVCSSDLDGPSRSFARATTDGDRHMLLQRTGYAVTLMTNTGLKHDGKNPAGAPSTLYSHNRSDERRVGNECVSTCSSRWSTYHSQNKTTNIRIDNIS